jgi:FAD/FMN-containing dehydrogenase
MIRFNDIVLHEKLGTVDIGAGLTWTEVYSYLVPKGLNVVGGRLNGVGVGGFILGGGQSSSQLSRASIPSDLTPLSPHRIFLEDQ